MLAYGKMERFNVAIHYGTTMNYGKITVFGILQKMEASFLTSSLLN